MATETLPGVLRFICRLAGTEDCDGGDDAPLLQRFLGHQDEKAFARLLDRHGPLVLGVCRHMLRDAADAEDAFQATFLVLARKAASIRKQESLPAWLHQVAVNICRTAQAADLRRRRGERQAVAMSETQCTSETAAHDWQHLMHEEVQRLPEKYRVPIVLCYFKGKTHDEAARELAWPVGTVKGRLSRARSLLRDRLTRRGVVVGAGAIAAALTRGAAAGPLPPALLVQTAKAAVCFVGKVSHRAVISAHVLALANGALQEMSTSKIPRALLVAFIAALLGVGTVFGFNSPGAVTKELSNPAASGVAGGKKSKDKDDDRPPPQKDGLSLSVHFAKKSYHTREPIEVAFQLKNESAKEMYIGDGYMGPKYHETGTARHFELHAKADDKIALRFWSSTLTEGDTLGIRKVFRLKPGEVYGGKIRLSAGVETDLGGAWRPYEISGGTFEGMGTDKRHAFGVDAAKYRFVMRYQVNPDTHGVWKPPQAFSKELLWQGVLDSHPIEIEITGEPPPAHKVPQAESKPVQMNGLEFVAVADSEWRLPDADKPENVHIGLRVTNRSKETKTLDRFDDVRILLTTQDDRELPFRGVREGIIASKRVQLAPGQTFLFSRPAQLEWVPGEKDKSLYFGGADGVGGGWSAGAQENLRPGRHALKISFRSVHSGSWNVTTQPVSIELRGREKEE